MKIYYFSKSIVRKSQSFKHHYSYSYGTGRENEYTSKEELIKEFKEKLDCDDIDALTEKEIESIVCEEMPDYDYYTIQLGTFDGYSITIITFKTYEECVTWIIKHTDAEFKYEGQELSIVGQRWGTDYREID